MKKLILSRKGFDSGSGGKPNLIYKNKLISLPIPQENTSIRYEDLKLIRGENCRKVMDDLGVKPFEECHFDPDLERKAYPRRSKGWKPIFGQTGAALSHLLSNGVGVGDLFLFFGWFKEVEKKDGKFVWKKNAPDLHIIYGYLEVGEMIDLNQEKAPNWAKKHPHCVLKDQFNPKGNILFIGREKLSLNPDLPGAGLFDFRPDLILTKENQEKHKRSVWTLPRSFFNEDGFSKMSYHYQRQGKAIEDGAMMEFQSVARGQEFVMENEEEIEEWARRLF